MCRIALIGGRQILRTEAAQPHVVSRLCFILLWNDTEDLLLHSFLLYFQSIVVQDLIIIIYIVNNRLLAVGVGVSIG